MVVVNTLAQAWSAPSQLDGQTVAGVDLRVVFSFSNQQGQAEVGDAPQQMKRWQLSSRRNPRPALMESCLKMRGPRADRSHGDGD